MGNERKRKQPQLEMTVAALQGRYGPWAVARGTGGRRAGPAAFVPTIQTGFEALDRALGTGGLPKGEVCEIAGPATSGKTTLALKFLAQAQQDGGQVAYIDQARYFDADYAHRCGVDLSHLMAGSPQDLTEALAMTEALARCGSLVAMVLDTVEFLWGDAAAAQLLAATLGRLRALLIRSGTVLLVLHDSLDARSPALSALAHASAIRLQVVRESWIRQNGDVRGYKARVEVLKNRHGPAGKVAQLAIEFNGTVHGDGI